MLGLLARLSTIKTRVLVSSIFFMADSVVSGNLTILKRSSLGRCGTDRRGHLGWRGKCRTRGRRNLTVVRRLRSRVACTPRSTLFLAFVALLFSAPPLVLTGFGTAASLGSAAAGAFLATGFFLSLGAIL